MNGVLYYASKYGSTRKISKWITEQIRSSHIELKQIQDKIIIDKDMDFYILGTPIFIGKPMDIFLKFITENKKIMHTKPLFLFITSWAESTEYRSECKKFIDLIHSYLWPCVPLLSESLPGRLYMDKISKRDKSIMERLLKRIDARSKQFKSNQIIFNDQTNKVQCEKFGRDINELLKY